MKSKQPTCLWLFYMLFVFSTSYFYGQTKNQKKSIAKHNHVSSLKKMLAKLEVESYNKEEELQKAAQKNAWQLKETLADGSVLEIIDLDKEGNPIYYTTFSDHVSTTSRANSLYEDGLLHLGITGKGMQVGVWDSGIARKTHTEFDTRVTVADGSTELGTHPTMVMGTLLASGQKDRAKGVAYEATGITNNWSRDKIEVAEAAANGLLLSNHSYGIAPDRVPDWYFGSYLGVSKDWDEIMYNTPYYLMITAAGNAQKSSENGQPISGIKGNGYDMLLGFATSKNGITVGAADASIDNNGNLVKATVASYSSFGPVDDGRIKPDIAGRGTDIYSTYSNNDTSYYASTGTSMATPGITGSMLLLQQYYEKLNGTYMRASTLKGLVLHTADDVNEVGPDYQMGWGVMNTKRAAELLVDQEFTAIVKEDSLLQGQSYTITVQVPENQKLTASISWTDPVSTFTNREIVNNTTAALVNDLDIRITQGNSIYSPWKLNASNATRAATKGDNKVDTFEKIDIDNAVGEYTITITHKGELANSLQHFSLLVSGVSLTDCKVNAPEEIQLKAKEDNVSLEWKAISDAFYEVDYKAKNSELWNTKYTDKNNILLPGLVLNNSYDIRIRTFCTENKFSEYSLVYNFNFSGKSTFLEVVKEEHTLEGVSNISVYPNPSKDVINIQGEKEMNSHFQIISASGLEVQQGTVEEESIPVSNLSSGMYFLVIDSSKGVSTTKFYKD